MKILLPKDTSQEEEEKEEQEEEIWGLAICYYSVVYFTYV